MGKEMFFIGTLHLGLTNIGELLSLIKGFDPKLILVEIVDKDIASNNLSSYPVEMVEVLKFARFNNLDVKGFDVKIDVINKDLSNEDILKISNEQVDFIRNYSWKDFNKTELLKELNSISHNLFDKKNWDLRQSKMKKNIDKFSKDKRCVVICGASHIPFFKNEFEKAKFL